MLFGKPRGSRRSGSDENEASEIRRPLRGYILRQLAAHRVGDERYRAVDRGDRRAQIGEISREIVALPRPVGEPAATKIEQVNSRAFRRSATSYHMRRELIQP